MLRTHSNCHSVCSSLGLSSCLSRKCWPCCKPNYLYAVTSAAIRHVCASLFASLRRCLFVCVSAHVSMFVCLCLASPSCCPVSWLAPSAIFCLSCFGLACCALRSADLPYTCPADNRFSSALAVDATVSFSTLQLLSQTGLGSHCLLESSYIGNTLLSSHPLSNKSCNFSQDPSAVTMYILTATLLAAVSAGLFSFITRAPRHAGLLLSCTCLVALPCWCHQYADSSRRGMGWGTTLICGGSGNCAFDAAG